MYWLIIAICIALDQISKIAIDNSMQLGESIELIPGLFDLYYIHNNGAAFSIFAGKQAFLIGLTAVLIIALTAYVVKQGKSVFKPECIAIALIVGGGIGNLINRVMYGYVIDFLDIHIIPIFNVADIFVCCGCALLVLSVMYLEPKARKKETEESDE